ncbi:hypothetical protein [Piscinibacterium candidicorallinum]|uniref:PH domain-containing protein n=1 Tax=Piscinibacterium candidicorallinum TaxID=1793872 RepID=A0ABV7H0R3_9BURK
MAFDSADLPTWLQLVCAGGGMYGLWVVCWTGQLTLSRVAITHRNIFGTYSIRWSEIDRVEFGSAYGTETYVFFGVGKHFAVYGPMVWSGADIEKAKQLLAEELQARSLIPVQTKSAEWRTHKNVRLR